LAAGSVIRRARQYVSIASAKSGKPNLSQLESSNSAINSIKREASSAGASVAEKTPSI
jgi:hypothetical protein